MPLAVSKIQLRGDLLRPYGDLKLEASERRDARLNKCGRLSRVGRPSLDSNFAA